MKPIYISRSNMPDFDKYSKMIKRLWKTRWLTNDGIYVQKLEKKLEKYWGVKNVICVSSGTAALMLTLKALDIKSINTSPDSFIATCSAPAWMGIKLNFVDDLDNIKGPALVTHTFGIPKLVKASPVIYDASHCFDVKVDNKYLVSYGDASIISFHSVKIFHTIEGGAIVTNNDDLAKKLRWMRNFGFNDRYTFYGAGINTKMTEFQAIMGLLNLPRIKGIRRRYNEIIKRYNKELGYKHEQVTYYPIWYSSEGEVLHAIEVFEDNKIFIRRYFYPPLNRVFGGKSCPKTEDKMSRVVSIPLYYELTDKEVDRIIKVVKQTL